MSLSLAQHRLRLTCDANAPWNMTCLLQSGAPKIPRGTDVFIEVGLQFKAAMIDSVTNISTVNLDILSTTDRSGSPLIQKTATPGSCSLADWTGLDAAKYSARFDLTATDTQFDMTDALEYVLDLWLVIHATLTGGERLTYGYGILQIEEDGAQNGLAVVTPTVPTAKISTAGDLYVYNPDTNKFHRAQATGAAGAVTLALEQTGVTYAAIP